MKTLIAVLTILFLFAGLASAEEKTIPNWEPTPECNKILQEGKETLSLLKKTISYLGDKIAEGDENKVYRNLVMANARLRDTKEYRRKLWFYSDLLKQEAVGRYRSGKSIYGKQGQIITEQEYDAAMSLAKEMRVALGAIPTNPEEIGELLTEVEVATIKKATGISKK